MSKKIRLLISGLLLAWFAWRISWPQVGQVFAQLRPALWLAAAGVLLAAQLISSVRWQQLAVPLGFNRPLRHIVSFYFIGMYFNLMLPTSVGGDVVRAWYLDGGSGRRLRAFVSVFLDRLSGLGVLLSLACLGVLLSPRPLPGWISACVWGCTGCGLLSLAALPVVLRFSHHAPWKIRASLEALHSLRSPTIWFWPTVLSVLVQVGNVLLVWLLALAIGAPVPTAFFWVLVPMVSLLTLLPVSVNGMGVREGAMCLLLAPLGVSEATAVSLAFLWFAVSAVVSLLGGLVYLFGRFPRPVISKNSKEEGTTTNGPVSGDSDQGRTGQLTTAA